ncbi:MAG: site-specific integrase [Verrucomicrobiota bacterium]|jgi:integrase
MKAQTNDTNRTGKTAAATRQANLSPDGKWRSFPKVPNLLQYVSTGTFYGRVKVDGKLYRESLETNVFSTAKLKLADFVKAKMRKRRQVGTPVSFAEARALYEQDLENEHTLSDNSKRYRRYCIQKLLASWPSLDDSRLNLITEAKCKEWAAKFSRQVDERYFNNTLGTLRGILKRASIVGIDDPTKDVKRLGVKLKELHLPEPHQFKDLLEMIETSGAGQAQHCADFVRFLAYSGCRLSEAKQVHWSDVNLERGFITVHSVKTRKANDAPKTRNVPTIADMKVLLKHLAAETHSPQDLVCHVGECEKSLTRACRLLKIPRITHHDLRHLFATRCIEAGVDVPTVSRWLGHNDGGALAMRVYGHLRDTHSAEMAQKVHFLENDQTAGEAGQHSKSNLS